MLTIPTVGFPDQTQLRLTLSLHGFVCQFSTARGLAKLRCPFDQRLLDRRSKVPSEAVRKYSQADRSAIIGVNSAQSVTRQRFTIAHEIGHLLLHKGEDVHIDEKPLSKLLTSREAVQRRDNISSQATDPLEIEANQFAAELLMPEEFIRLSVEDLDPETPVDEAIESLSHLFQVSSMAIIHRLTNLKIIDSAAEVAD